MRRLAAALVLVATPTLGSQLPPDLSEALGAFDRAQLRGDTGTLAALVADDYVLVNSDSSLQDKESYLADFHVPGFQLEEYSLQETVAKAWGDAAVIGGLLRLRWRQDGTLHSRLLRIVHVWARRDGRWQATHTQLTRVPDEPVPQGAGSPAPGSGTDEERRGRR